MEASALQAPAGLARSRISIGAPLLGLRSDQQLVALFRAGHEEAFRVIHDRYRQRLFAYTRQMLPGSRHDAEDALQDVFMRAYSGLRANDRELALRAWLYRVAHNRCIDELRRPAPPAPELIEMVRSPIRDPIAEAEQRESLARLIADVRRLPEQQRSALLMRELSGMSYVELSSALGVSVPAVKSLLVRARVGLAQALEARDTACSAIRDELIVAHDRGVRPNATARRHLRDCAGCREFRSRVRGMSHQLAALVPALGPVGVLAKLLGIGGGAGGGAAAGSGAAAAGGAAGTGGVVAAGGVLATGASHVATLLAAAVVTAGGAIEIQHTISAQIKHQVHHHAGAAAGGTDRPTALAVSGVAPSTGGATSAGVTTPPVPAPVGSPVPSTARTASTQGSQASAATSPPAGAGAPGSPPVSSGADGSPSSAGGPGGSLPVPGANGSTAGALSGPGTAVGGTTLSTGGASSGSAGGSSAAGGGSPQGSSSATSAPAGSAGSQSAPSPSPSITTSSSLGSAPGPSDATTSSGSSSTSH